jgi:ABC-type transporter MlaC component
MSFRKIVQAALIIATLALAGTASAGDDAKTFMQREQGKITAMLQRSASQAELSAALAQLVDYDALTAASFGKYWGDGTLDDAKKAEVKGLLRQLIENNYKKNLKKILDYKTEFADPTGPDSAKHVKMKAQSSTNARSKAHIEYILRVDGTSWKIIDLVTEQSRMTVNYYRQFDEMLRDSTKGYPYLVQKLKDAIAKG